VHRFALFNYGFRPFFLFAGIHALLAVPLWLWMYGDGIAPFANLPPQYWHGHEMIYGFASAAIAGFLLTAVPSWTQSRGFGGRPLMLLTALWIAGRAVLVMTSQLPPWLVGVIELSFLPVLAALLAPPLLRARNRNTPMLAVIGVLWLIDGAFVTAMFTGNALLARGALHLAINLVLILVTVIGGRIVPAFTANALRRRGDSADLVAHPWLDRLVIAVMILVAMVDAIWPGSTASGVLAAFAAVVHALRLSGWRGFRTVSEPIVWALHIAYAWLPIGFSVKASWVLLELPWAAHWLHAFTLGVIATMILAVMTRASLGHTGRPLVVSTSIAVAYLALTAAAVVRVFGPSIEGLDYRHTVIAAGGLWTVAFAIYLIVYAPILIQPRADGKPG
jgi:uncharacterized protein involved in response to NO